MAQKIFVSVVGTGFYENCSYAGGDFKSEETRFVQLATLERLQKTGQWNKDDKMVFLLTDKARTLNWETAPGRKRKNRAGVEEEYIGLKEELGKMPFAGHICDVPIPEGKDEDELWQIFNILFSQIEEDAELYIDITHSFRYLPMLLLVFCNYAKFLKNTRTCSISYGNWESRDTGTNTAPFVDLVSLSALQDWTYAAANYLDNGNPKQLVALSQNALRPILRAARGSNPAANALRTFVNMLQTVADEMRTCRGINLVNATNIAGLQRAMDNVQSPFIAPFVPVFDKIKTDFQDFDSGTNTENGFLAAEWCLKNGMYQQALTIMYENIVTAICMEESMDWRRENDRNLVSSAFKIYHNNIPEDQWILPKGADPHEKVKHLMNNSHLQKLARPFSEIGGTRNDINHSGMRNNPMAANALINRINGYFDEIRNIFPKQPPHENQ